MPEDIKQSEDSALRALNENDLEGAQAQFIEIIKQDPRNVNAHLGLAYVAVMRPDYGAALREYQAVIELDPTEPVGYQQSGEVYRMQGDYQHAFQMYQRALECDPNDPDSHYGLGLLCQNDGNLESAVEHYSKVLEAVPDNADARGNLGDSYMGLDDFKAAIDQFRKLIELVPGSVLAHRRCGDAYHSMGEYDRAVEMYNKAIELDANDADTHGNLGELHMARGDFKAALAEFRKVIELVPGSVIAHRRCGDAYRSMEDNDQALEMYGKALTLDQNDADVHGNLGELHMALGDFEAALGEFRRVIEIVPDSVLGHRRSGDAHRLMEDNDQALVMYGQALKLDPYDADAHNGVAMTYETLSRYPQALEHYGQVIKLAPESPVGYARRAGINEFQGDYMAALADLQEAARLSGEESELHVSLGRILLDLEAYDRAIGAFDKALELEPTNADTWVLKADALRLWGQDFNVSDKLRAAVLAAEEAMRLDGKNAPAYAVSGRALVSLGDFDAGLSALDRAVSLDPGYDWAHWERAKALYKHHKAEAARKAFASLADKGGDLAFKAKIGQALMLGPEALKSLPADLPADGMGLVRLATILTEFENWESVVDYYRKATLQDPSLAQAYNGLAWYQSEKLEQNLQECRINADHAVQLSQDGTDRALSLDTLGWIWYKLGDLKQARSFIEEAVTLREPDLLIRTHFEVISQKLAQFVDAG